MNWVQASQGLLLCLPCYSELVQGTEAGPQVWEGDAVLASRLQFLMSMLGPCIARLPKVCPHVPSFARIPLLRKDNMDNFSAFWWLPCKIRVSK